MRVLKSALRGSAPPAVTTLSTESLVQMRLAHLGAIQSIIARMSSQSGMVKGFCVTLAGAILALKPQAAMAIVPVLALLFALVDAGYLSIERDFKDTYDTVARRPIEDAGDLRIVRSTNKTGRFLSALCSFSVFGFYIAVGLAPVVVGFALSLIGSP
jgi:hypothetical protein